MSRTTAAAVIDSFDRMDPTNSREVRPSIRMRHRRTNWYAFAGWALVAFAVMVVLAGFSH